MFVVKTKLGFSKIHGIGVFAEEFIHRGSVVQVYDTMLDKAYPKSMVRHANPLFQEFIKQYAYLDGDVYILLLGDNARFLNHSLYPNLVGFVGDNRTDMAHRDIDIGEELTVNYYEFDDEAVLKLGAFSSG